MLGIVGSNLSQQHPTRRMLKTRFVSNNINWFDVNHDKKTEGKYQILIEFKRVGLGLR